ncbi:methyltransferase domain-containing protein [Scytonema sp. NUACC26]|uniref:class I SAM-dependent methyltransferase n=1 Tax=Scytonema sp. NUACC26 TaxID=3140176 RepID=UPI0034DC7F6D
MRNLEKALQVSSGIRELALKAMKELPTSHPAYHAARERAKRPVDYMRYAEFDSILRNLEITPQMTILDVSSPQWFSLYLADKHPEAEFYYINIIDSEIEPYKEIANCLDIKNLKYQKQDIRKLKFQDNTFHKVISISVIEHIYPEEDGDLKALNEIKRVLKPESDFLLTIPYKAQKNIVYMDGAVYERSEKNRNFFAREYDKEMFDNLIERSGLALKDSWYICEKKGIFSVDYYEWGSGKNSWLAKYFIKGRRRLEQVLDKSLDEMLTKQYLTVSREITTRVVNISAVLKKVNKPKSFS